MAADSATEIQTAEEGTHWDFSMPTAFGLRF
jgi:hypothetical protein